MPIYKEKDRYIVKVCINGKQILRRKYLGREINSLKEAKECEKDLILQYSERLKDYKLNDLFNLFEEYLYKRYKETSAKRYLYAFNGHIKDYFKNKKISFITTSYLEYVNDSINGLAYKDIESLLFILKTFLSFLGAYGLKVNTNCIYKFKNSRNVKKEHDYYTEDEFLEFIKVIDDKKDLLMFKLLFYYGLRCGELRALQVRDFKADRIYISKELSNKGRLGGQKILDTKTSSSVRYYPYVADVKQLFLEIKKENSLKSSSFLFESKIEGKVIGETSIRRKVIEYSSRANLRTIKIHEFRHSCATYLINKNIDPKDIASWLGHSSINTTLTVYAHLLPIRKEAIKNIIDKNN